MGERAKMTTTDMRNERMTAVVDVEVGRNVLYG
jgi:hypothetical protein